MLKNWPRPSGCQIPLALLESARAAWLCCSAILTGAENFSHCHISILSVIYQTAPNKMLFEFTALARRGDVLHIWNLHTYACYSLNGMRLESPYYESTAYLPRGIIFLWRTEPHLSRGDAGSSAASEASAISSFKLLFLLKCALQGLSSNQWTIFSLCQFWLCKSALECIWGKAFAGPCKCLHR